jgi:hypothetical protein
MPTLQCAACGARYYTAASQQLLKLVLTTFRCELCSEHSTLRAIDDGVGYLAPSGERQEPGAIPWQR